MAGQGEDRQVRGLNAVLRLLLTAVHQQFIHILLLRSWGHSEVERRMVAVDKVDFVSALRIVDHVVAMGALPDLGGAGGSFTPHLPAPGASRDDVLAAELALERRLLGTIEAARSVLSEGDDRAARVLMEGALSPRRNYLVWLEGQASSRGAGPPTRHHDKAARSLDALLAQLIVAIEQALVHAFVLQHAGEDRLADAAWATSGAAMMQATSIVKLFASQGFAPSFAETAAAPEAPRVGLGVAEVLAFEQALAERCSRSAEEAAAWLGGADESLLWRDIAAHYRDLGNGPPHGEHPAARNPAAFRSFDDIYRKHVTGRPERVRSA
jgi:bacterioferritin (cytochrome b1)